MAFYPQFNGTVIVVTLFNHLKEKPILRRACLDVFKNIIESMLDGGFPESEGEMMDRTTRATHILATVAEFVKMEEDDGSGRTEEIVKDYDLADAMTLWWERNGEDSDDEGEGEGEEGEGEEGESELLQMWNGQFYHKLARCVLEEVFTPLIDDNVWNELTRYIVRDGDGYNPDYTSFELERDD